MKLTTPIRKRHPRVKDDGYLAFLHSLPCIVTGRVGVEAAHIRFGSLPHGKRPTGMSEKPDDRWAVPMSPEEHRTQHTMSERGYWSGKGIDPLVTAALLWSAFHADDLDGAISVCQSARELILWRR